jgi:hypothetical protein
MKHIDHVVVDKLYPFNVLVRPQNFEKAIIRITCSVTKDSVILNEEQPPFLYNEYEP